MTLPQGQMPPTTIETPTIITPPFAPPTRIIPVDIVHDVLVHLLFVFRGGLVLRVRTRVDDTIHVDV